MNQSRFEKRPAKPTLHPRKVIGGLRLRAKFEPAPAGSGEKTGAAGSGEAAGAPAVPMGGWSPVAALWLRTADANAPIGQLVEGLAYARSGQARSLEAHAGVISARVQGRMPNAYSVQVRLPTFTQAQWEQVVAAISAQARHSAALLAGEMPALIEEVFAPFGLRLFPSEASDLACSCNCEIFGAGSGSGRVGGSGGGGSGGASWCKHVCSVMYLMAERLSEQPLGLFALRGLPETELLERLRQARTLAGVARTGVGAVPIYTQHIPSVGMAMGGSAGDGVAAALIKDEGSESETEATTEARVSTPRPRAQAPLDQCIADFWDPEHRTRAELDALDLPIERPEVTHPLLRRLGASPFTPTLSGTPRPADIALERGRKGGGSRWGNSGAAAQAREAAAALAAKANGGDAPVAKFPLVGLLATCYDVISEAAVNAANTDSAAGEGSGEAC